MRIPDHFTCFLKNLYANQEATIRPGHGPMVWFKIEKGVRHHAYLTSVQSTSCRMLGWMKYKQESRLLGEISITSDTQMIPPYGRKRRRTKELLDEIEKRE